MVWIRKFSCSNQMLALINTSISLANRELATLFTQTSSMMTYIGRQKIGGRITWTLSIIRRYRLMALISRQIVQKISVTVFACQSNKQVTQSLKGYYSHQLVKVLINNCHHSTPGTGTTGPSLTLITTSESCSPLPHLTTISIRNRWYFPVLAHPALESMQPWWPQLEMKHTKQCQSLSNRLCWWIWWVCHSPVATSAATMSTLPLQTRQNNKACAWNGTI